MISFVFHIYVIEDFNLITRAILSFKEIKVIEQFIPRLKECLHSFTVAGSLQRNFKRRLQDSSKLEFSAIFK